MNEQADAILPGAWSFRFCNPQIPSRVHRTQCSCKVGLAHVGFHLLDLAGLHLNGDPVAPGRGSRGDSLRPDCSACILSVLLSLSVALGKVLTSLLLMCKMG